MSTVLRYAAFDVDGEGGNPAGVVLDARGMDDTRMQRIAAGVGYSETAFLFNDEGAGGHRFRIRYFSPRAEVAFCGHATIATAVALAEREGTGNLWLVTSAGEVRVGTRPENGRILATLTSVAPAVREVGEADLASALTAPPFTPATRSRRARSSRIRPPVPPPRPSAHTCDH